MNSKLPIQYKFLVKIYKKSPSQVFIRMIWDVMVFQCLTSGTETAIPIGFQKRKYFTEMYLHLCMYYFDRVIQ